MTHRNSRFALVALVAALAFVPADVEPAEAASPPGAEPEVAMDQGPPVVDLDLAEFMRMEVTLDAAAPVQAEGVVADLSAAAREAGGVLEAPRRMSTNAGPAVTYLPTMKRHARTAVAPMVVPLRC